MTENTGKEWEKLKENSKGFTIFGKTVRNTQVVRICFEYKQTCLFATKGTCQFQFWELFQFATPPNTSHCQQNGFIDSKYMVSISLLNQGNHNMGQLWIQTNHNLNHKRPDYGQPVTINIYDQTMISLESCSMYYYRVFSACSCMGGQPGLFRFLATEFPRDSMMKLGVSFRNFSHAPRKA